ncbi:MAG: (Fe-S)-binding protein [Candidatus Hydrothermarchaeota archaeon]
MKKLESIPDKVVLFEGCITSRRMHIIRFALRFLLDKFGIDYIVLDKEQCCGSPIFRAGDEDLAKRQLLYNLREVEKTGRNVIVTACPGCGSTLKSEEAEKRGIKVIHIMEIFMKLAEEGRLFKEDNIRPINAKVTAHFPCHLIRGMGVDCFKGFKEILEQIPGIEYIELEEANACCGAGGGVRASQIDLAKKIRERKLNFIEETQADLVITSCPFCELHIGEGLKEVEISKRIISLPTLMALAYPDFRERIDDIVKGEAIPKEELKVEKPLAVPE